MLIHLPSFDDVGRCDDQALEPLNLIYRCLSFSKKRTGFQVHLIPELIRIRVKIHRRIIAVIKKATNSNKQHNERDRLLNYL